MAQFDNGELEEFLIFVRTFDVTLEASGTLADGVNMQYLHTLVREVFCQFDTLSDEVVITTSENLQSIILGLSTYLFLFMHLQKKSRDTPRNY